MARTKKTMLLSETLTNLFGKAENDLAAYEEAMAEGAKTLLTLENSSEALLRGILNVAEGDKWVFAEDRKVYEEVKEAILNRAKDKKIEINIPGSIASGKWRAEARDSSEPLIRLAGRLAGRLSTLMSKSKGSSTKTKGKGKGADKEADRGDKVGKAWEEGHRAGMAEMGVIVLASIAAKKSLKEIAKAINEATSPEEREAAASRIKEMLTTKKAA